MRLSGSAIAESPGERTPWGLAELNPLVRSRRVRSFGTVLIGVLGLGATLFSFRLLQDREESLNHADFEHAASVAGRLAQREFYSGIEALRSLVAFHVSSVEVERHEFADFSRALLEDLRVVNAVAWAPVVSAQEREATAEDVRRRAASAAILASAKIDPDLETYQISEWRDGGARVPVAGDGPSYPILYVEPFEKYRSMLGIDLATQPAVREAIARSEKSMHREAACEVCFFGDLPDERCFLVVGPVFKNRHAEGKERGPVEGVFLSLFRIAELVRIVDQAVQPASFNVYPQFVNLQSETLPQESGSFYMPLFPQEESGLGLWFVRKESFPARRVAAAPLVLVLGISFTALLVAYAFLLTHWSTRVESQVAQRTEELRQVNVRLSAEIAERIAAERKLELQAEELARSNSDLEEFAYLASHDLRAPLRAIANISEWLEEDLGEALEGESRGQLDLLRRRVVRMERIVEDLLAYSRAGRDEAEREEVDTRQLVENAVFLINPPSSFVVEVDGSMPIFETQRVPLEQIFGNLIDNAIKHHHRSDGTVRVSSRELDGFYEFSVEDDGPGIEARYHERVFKMFQALQARDKVEGSGMGLALVKKLVTRQGGSVWLESEPGKGARFIFTWPAGPSSPKALNE